MRRPVLFIAAAWALGACGGPDPRPWGPLPPENGPYEVSAAAHPGTIRGTCRLIGEAQSLRLREWPGMGTTSGQDDESVRLGEGQALGGCLVSLAGLRSGKDWPASMRTEDRRLLLRVKPGRYEPHVAWVRTGTQIDFASEIGMDITVRMLAEGRGTIANFVVAPKATLGDVAQTFLSEPAFVHVTEDHRGAFNAWLLVSPHPYVDLTSANDTPDRAAGEYRLEDVPAGDYEVVCRHEPMDRREETIGGGFVYRTGPAIEVRRRVRVGPDETVTLDLEVPAPGKAAAPTSPR